MRQVTLCSLLAVMANKQQAQRHSQGQEIARKSDGHVHVAFIMTSLIPDSRDVDRRCRAGRLVKVLPDIHAASRVWSWARVCSTGGVPRRFYTALGGTLSGLAGYLHERALEVQVSRNCCDLGALQRYSHCSFECTRMASCSCIGQRTCSSSAA